MASTKQNDAQKSGPSDALKSHGLSLSHSKLESYSGISDENDRNSNLSPSKSTDPTRKKTFKITSVKKGGSGSGDVGGDNDADSIDGLDESQTEDLSSEFYDSSKATDLDMDLQDCMNIPLTPDELTSTTTIVVKQKPDQNSQSRFRVVKIETKEPFRRGKWVCYDFFDTTPAAVVTVEKNGSKMMEDSIIQSALSGNLSSSSSVHYIQDVNDSSSNIFIPPVVPMSPPRADGPPIFSDVFVPIQPAPASQVLSQLDGLSSDAMTPFIAQQVLMSVANLPSSSTSFHNLAQTGHTTMIQSLPHTGIYPFPTHASSVNLFQNGVAGQTSQMINLPSDSMLGINGSLAPSVMAPSITGTVDDNIVQSQSPAIISGVPVPHSHSHTQIASDTFVAQGVHLATEPGSSSAVNPGVPASMTHVPHSRTDSAFTSSMDSGDQMGPGMDESTGSIKTLQGDTDGQASECLKEAVEAVGEMYMGLEDNEDDVDERVSEVAALLPRLPVRPTNLPSLLDCRNMDSSSRGCYIMPARSPCPSPLPQTFAQHHNLQSGMLASRATTPCFAQTSTSDFQDPNYDRPTTNTPMPYPQSQPYLPTSYFPAPHHLILSPTSPCMPLDAPLTSSATAVMSPSLAVPSVSPHSRPGSMTFRHVSPTRVSHAVPMTYVPYGSESCNMSMAHSSASSLSGDMSMAHSSASSLSRDMSMTHELSPSYSRGMLMTHELSSPFSRDRSMTPELSPSFSHGMTMTHELSPSYSHGMMMTHEIPSSYSHGMTMTQEIPSSYSRGMTMTHEIPSSYSHGMTMTQEIPSSYSRGMTMTHEIPSSYSRGMTMTHEIPSSYSRGMTMTHEMPSSYSHGTTMTHAIPSSYSRGMPMTHELSPSHSHGMSMTHEIPSSFSRGMTMSPVPPAFESYGNSMTHLSPSSVSHGMALSPLSTAPFAHDMSMTRGFPSSFARVVSITSVPSDAQPVTYVSPSSVAHDMSLTHLSPFSNGMPGTPLITRDRSRTPVPHGSVSCSMPSCSITRSSSMACLSSMPSSTTQTPQQPIALPQSISHRYLTPFQPVSLTSHMTDLASRQSSLSPDLIANQSHQHFTPPYAPPRPACQTFQLVKTDSRHSSLSPDLLPYHVPQSMSPGHLIPSYALFRPVSQTFPFADQACRRPSLSPDLPGDKSQRQLIPSNTSFQPVSQMSLACRRPSLSPDLPGDKSQRLLIPSNTIFQPVSQTSLACRQPSVSHNLPMHHVSPQKQALPPPYPIPRMEAPSIGASGVAVVESGGKADAVTARTNTVPRNVSTDPAHPPPLSQMSPESGEYVLCLFRVPSTFNHNTPLNLSNVCGGCHL